VRSPNARDDQALAMTADNRVFILRVFHVFLRIATTTTTTSIVCLLALPLHLSQAYISFVLRAFHLSLSCSQSKTTIGTRSNHQSIH
jgi:hypothetical protein